MKKNINSVSKDKNRVKKNKNSQENIDSNYNASSASLEVRQEKKPDKCPYCQCKNFNKRGTRRNKFEVVQLYKCKNEECGRTFSSQAVKGKHFPLEVVAEGLSLYNLGLTLEQTCKLLQEKFNISPKPAGLAKWLAEYSKLCRFARLRPYATKMFKAQEIIEVVTFAHQQIYRFRYHRAKIALMLQEFGNRNFRPLQDFLNNISSETPHQYFQKGARMSEIKSKFNKAEMLVKSKNNYANLLTAFVVQFVADNRQRHEKLQRFMIANDSCTVATEVPVYIRKEDIEHMENQLNFEITKNGKIMLKGKKRAVALPKILTGHIDFIQVRNGQIHLLDYKPNAAKEKPIEQLTWYALAMSRLTGLRIFEFKCAWFDEKDYFEFYPLHVVKKISSKRKRKVHYRDGKTHEIPQENTIKIVD
jgi:transposase-like protein